MGAGRIGGRGQGRPETCPVESVAPSGELTAGMGCHYQHSQRGCGELTRTAAVCTVKAQDQGGGSGDRGPAGQTAEPRWVLSRSPPCPPSTPPAPGTLPLPGPRRSQHLRADQVLTQHPASKHRLVTCFRCLVGERVQVPAS